MGKYDKMYDDFPRVPEDSFKLDPGDPSDDDGDSMSNLVARTCELTLVEMSSGVSRRADQSSLSRAATSVQGGTWLKSGTAPSSRSKAQSTPHHNRPKDAKPSTAGSRGAERSQNAAGNPKAKKSGQKEKEKEKEKERIPAKRN